MDELLSRLESDGLWSKRDFLRINVLGETKGFKWSEEKRSAGVEELPSLYMLQRYEVLERKSGTYAEKPGLSDRKSKKIIS
jgi:hypothetical protein